MEIGANFLTLTLTIDLLNPKSIVFDIVSRTYQVLSHSDHGFSFYRANNVHNHTARYQRTYTHHDKVIAVSVPPYYIVDADNIIITLRAKLSGAVYCYRSCLWRAGGVCLCVGVCLWVCYYDNSKLRISIFTKLGL